MIAESDREKRERLELISLDADKSLAEILTGAAKVPLNCYAACREHFRMRQPEAFIPEEKLAERFAQLLRR
jgi:hypothetical protein